MQTREISNLTHLTAKGALRRFLAEGNERVLRWLLALAGPISAVSALVLALEWIWVPAITWGIVFGLVLLFFFGRRSEALGKVRRQLLVIFLAAFFAAAVWTLPEPAAGLVFGGLIFQLVLLLFRLRPLEHVAISGGLLASAVALSFRPEVFESATGRTIFLTVAVIFTLLCTALRLQWTRNAERSFLKEWHRVAAQEKERTRMRSEIDDARTIQLSMLPTQDPGLSWLDFSAVCLPASEVGGDYYDYFSLAPDRLAVVVGDVSGHGVASGLVLSGIRSGLYLLRDQLNQPVQVLRRLNEMLRSTAPKRMFVTLQIVVLDWTRQTLTVASAGHPPLLHGSAGAVRACGSASLPLGTGLEAKYTQLQRPLSAGDSLILYTDGIPEISDFRGLPMGPERWAEEASRALRAGTARQVRDSILNGVSRYKGDVEATDDMTLIVMRIDPGLTG